MDSLAAPIWITTGLFLEPWQVLALPVGTVLALSLLAWLTRQRVAGANGLEIRLAAGLRFMIGFAGGLAMSWGIVRLIHEVSMRMADYQV